MIIAYGFGAKRISVSQPIAGLYSASTVSMQLRSRGSVFPVFKDLLTRTAVGIRFASDATDSRQIHPVTSGFTIEEINFLKESYDRVRDQVIAGSTLAKVGLAGEPCDTLRRTVSGIAHHGALMMAKRGLSLSFTADSEECRRD